MDKALYIGIFLDDNSCYKLYEHSRGHSLEHDILHKHCTLTFMPTEAEIKKIRPYVGVIVNMEVIGHGCDGKNEGYAVALGERLEKMCKNSIPHITMSISSDGRPKDTSNLIFKALKTPFLISGRIGVYYSENGVICQKEFID